MSGSEEAELPTLRQLLVACFARPPADRFAVYTAAARRPEHVAWHCPGRFFSGLALGSGLRLSQVNSLMARAKTPEEINCSRTLWTVRRLVWFWFGLVLFGSGEDGRCKYVTTRHYERTTSLYKTFKPVAKALGLSHKRCRRAGC